jgi:hypothetical protein
MDAHGVNFDVKYSRLDRYFWNKYQMCSSFVGEELKEKEDRRRTLISENLQLQHIKELYEIAMANVCPKKEEKAEEESRKLVDITKEMDKIINKNLRLADRLIAKVHRREGQTIHELTRSSEEDSSSEETTPTNQPRRPKALVTASSPSVKKVRTITTQKENGADREDLRTKPIRQRLAYRKRASCNVLTHDKVAFGSAVDTPTTHSKVGDRLRKHQLTEQDTVKTMNGTAVHNSFHEIE